MKSFHTLNLLLIAATIMTSATTTDAIAQRMGDTDQSTNGQEQSDQAQQTVVSPDPVPMDQAAADQSLNKELQDNRPLRLKRRDDAHVDPEITELERRMWQRVNQDRTQNGSAPIKLAPQLSDLARKYAEYMMKANFFAHVDPKGRNPETRAHAAGFMGPIYENIAWTTRQDSDIDRLMVNQDEMMGEPRGQKNHRYNMLVPQHSAIGIGIARSRGKLIMVQEFVDAPDDAR